MAQPLVQSLPQYDGKNMAPAAPFLALRENNGHTSPFAQHHLAEAIKAKYQEKIKDKEQSWKEMVAVGQMIALFIEGKQILDWNPYTNRFTPRKLTRSDPNRIKAVNFMQYYCTNWQSKWGSSNPDILVEPLSNADQDINRARKANAVVDHLEDELYDDWYVYHEGILAQCFGWYGNRVKLSYKNAKQIQLPDMQDQEVTIGKGFGKCHDCGYSGSEFNSIQISQTDSMPVCKDCGSTGVIYEPPPTQIMQQQVGMKTMQLPKVTVEQLPFPSCRWDLRYRAEDSSWFLYEQEASENMLRRVLGEIRFPEGDTGNDFGLDATASLAAMGSPVGGRSDTPKQKRSGPTISELYLSADDLYDVIIKGDEQTVEGDMLPAGARGSDVWPDGACFVGLNGFSLLWGIYAEQHCKSITTGVYHMKPLSGTGRGVGDAAEIQKRWNRFDSRAVRHWDTRATPATLVAQGAIPANKRHLLSQPDVDIPIDLANFPEIKSVQDLIFPLQGQSIPGDMLQYTYQHLGNFMQLAYHITDFAGGVPRVDNKTATGAEILDANADQVFHPALDIKADVYLKTARKAFDLWCSVNPIKQFVPLKAQAKSGSRGLDISGPDVAGEYNWQYVPGSQIPKNRRTKRNDLIQFYSLFGGILGYLQAKGTNPQEVAETERAFDMDFATNDFDELGEICRARFEFAKNLLEQSLQMQQKLAESYGVQLPQPNPMMILPEVRPTMLVTEADHPQKAAWFARLLDTTEGQEMSDLERNLVSALIQGHMMLAKGQAIELAQGQAETQVAGNAPIAAAEQQNAAAQSDQQHQQNLEANAQSHAQGMQAADQAAQHEQAAADLSHQQGMERDAAQNKAAAQREKVKQQVQARAS